MTSICSTNPWPGEKRKTYKKFKAYTWIKQRKDKQAQKGLTKDNMFYVDFLAQVVKIPNAFIIFMHLCNANVISTRYEASSSNTYH